MRQVIWAPAERTSSLTAGTLGPEDLAHIDGHERPYWDRDELSGIGNRTECDPAGRGQSQAPLA